MSINRDINETWIDGAFESTKHNLLQEVDRWNPNEPKREVVSFFGAYLPNHPIYELEILPLLVAVKIWSTYIVGKLVVHYLDNDAARSAFVRAHTSTDLGAVFIAEYVEFEYKFLFSMFARAASHSNPSDERTPRGWSSLATGFC